MMRIGHKVTLISHPTKTVGPRGEQWPQFGVVYTIREIEEDALRFEEIRNDLRLYSDGMGECGWFSDYFRRVMDISSLEEIAAEVTKGKVLELTDS